MNEEGFRCRECGLVVEFKGPPFNYCPKCGALAARFQDACNSILSLYQGDGRLNEAIDRFRKTAYTDAARAAMISLEMELRRIGNTESYGSQLVDELLSFDYDRKSGTFVREPVIKVNDLSSPSDRTEQEGIRQLILGMFKGLRNSLMHQHLNFSPIHALSMVVMSHLLMDILNQGSILNPRFCVWRRVPAPPGQGEGGD